MMKSLRKGSPLQPSEEASSKISTRGSRAALDELWAAYFDYGPWGVLFSVSGCLADRFRGSLPTPLIVNHGVAIASGASGHCGAFRTLE